MIPNVRSNPREQGRTCGTSPWTHRQSFCVPIYKRNPIYGQMLNSCIKTTRAMSNVRNIQPREHPRERCGMNPEIFPNVHKRSRMYGAIHASNVERAEHPRERCPTCGTFRLTEKLRQIDPIRSSARHSSKD